MSAKISPEFLASLFQSKLYGLILKRWMRRICRQRIMPLRNCSKELTKFILWKMALGQFPMNWRYFFGGLGNKIELMKAEIIGGEYGN
jgi:hypothetical protein